MSLSYGDMRRFPLWLILEWPEQLLEQGMVRATVRFIALRGGAIRPLWHAHPVFANLVIVEHAIIRDDGGAEDSPDGVQ